MATIVSGTKGRGQAWSPRVLVACPVAEIKNYALDEYMDAYTNYEYENKSLFMVDNTIDDGGEYHEKLLARGINSVHISVNPSEAVDKVSTSWKYILAYA